MIATNKATVWSDKAAVLKAAKKAGGKDGVVRDLGNRVEVDLPEWGKPGDPSPFVGLDLHKPARTLAWTLVEVDERSRA